MQKDALSLKDRIRQVSSQSVVITPAASASSGNLLKMQLLGPHSRPAGLAPLGVRPRNLFYQTLQVILKDADI